MDAIYIAGAVPFFVLLIGIEFGLSVRAHKKYYRFADAINSLSCGIFQQALAVFLGFWLVTAYAHIYQTYHAFEISLSSVPAWILCFLLVDLAYYLFHWASHRVNFIWATHVVHHQSEEYNLSTALRQSAFQGMISTVFNWPLALIGFPPVMAVTAITFITLYQFWIHTRLIKKMGWFETVFNTPSHHRVHHGIDPQNIDKNYAGLFIVWDKLFGTFLPEGPIEPNYGTVQPLASWNPLWANLDGWVKIAKLSRSCTRLQDKLYAWIAPPEWLPKEQGGAVIIPEVDAKKRKLYHAQEPKKVQIYVGIQFFPVLIAAVILLLIQNTAPLILLVSLTAWITLSLTAWGGLFENKSWSKPLEAVRLIALVPLFLAVADFFKNSGL